MTSTSSIAGSDAQRGPESNLALSAFVLLAKFLGVPADPGQIAHDHGEPANGYGLEDLARISKRLKIVAKIRSASLADLAKLPLPALAELRDGQIVILLKVDQQEEALRFLIQRGDGERPEVWTSAEMDGRFAGRLLLMTTREQMAGVSRPFDISWFIPALVKYRGALGDVLIGSFFLQLMGLVSPIFFQLVIDKVLVHQSLTTLLWLCRFRSMRRSRSSSRRPCARSWTKNSSAGRKTRHSWSKASRASAP
ncbi:hypothetical protein CAF53_16825 [Sphingobium sp. LB126]|uniref:cysteine peptidase family C39 domain-containing protein n=1 Tax=Sphingobium sp. LB126 TaxID=1983755 RepID=UPI000C203CB2|nr:cysteine peptidase family C39 domain-containing protein [Sphingobium sp. LB126]PJG45908.1 hypothetical protein CAF53_16825 [Sphingobium sp. LB126]